MIEKYKLRNFLYDKEASNGLIEISHRNHRVNNIQIKTRNAKLKLRKTFISARVVNDWNHLPASVVYADNYCGFKKKLDDHWMNHQFRLCHTETKRRFD